MIIENNIYFQNPHYPPITGGYIGLVNIGEILLLSPVIGEIQRGQELWFILTKYICSVLFWIQNFLFFYFIKSSSLGVFVADF